MPTIYVNNSVHQPIREREFYPTPIELCKAALKLVPKDCPMNDVLEPGAGSGVWGRALEEVYPRIGYRYVHGIEIRDVEVFLDDYTFNCYDNWSYYNFLEENLFHPYYGYDLVMGNPPYSLQEKFIDKSLDLLKDEGYLLFLLKLSFLESKLRYNKYFNNNLNPKEVHVSVRRVSFTGNKKSNADAYAIYLWKKGWIGETTLKWLEWNYD